jgi:hypothetical protein
LLRWIQLLAFPHCLEYPRRMKLRIFDFLCDLAIRGSVVKGLGDLQEHCGGLEGVGSFPTAISAGGEGVERRRGRTQLRDQPQRLCSPYRKSGMRSFPHMRGLPYHLRAYHRPSMLPSSLPTASSQPPLRYLQTQTKAPTVSRSSIAFDTYAVHSGVAVCRPLSSANRIAQK